MKDQLTIEAVESWIHFPEEMIENFFNDPERCYKNPESRGFRSTCLSDNYLTIGCSSAFLPVNGMVDILLSCPKTGRFDRMSIPVASAFLVTCTKESRRGFKMTWSCCLS